MFNPSQADSAKATLAVSFVNGFVNAGFRKDKLMTLSGANEWIYKHKEHGAVARRAVARSFPTHRPAVFSLRLNAERGGGGRAGMLSATASLGLIYLWDIDFGLNEVDAYVRASEDMIKVRPPPPSTIAAHPGRREITSSDPGFGTFLPLAVCVCVCVCARRWHGVLPRRAACLRSACSAPPSTATLTRPSRCCPTRSRRARLWWRKQRLRAWA